MGMQLNPLALRGIHTLLREVLDILHAVNDTEGNLLFIGVKQSLSL